MNQRNISVMPVPAIPKLVNDPLQNELEIELASRPGVYDVIKGLALKAKRAGHSTYSIKALVEIARWEHSFGLGKGAKGWFWDNRLSSRLGRKLMQDVPELAGFFKLRSLTSIKPRAGKKVAA